MKKITTEQRLEKLEKSNYELTKEIMKLKESIEIQQSLNLKDMLNGTAIDIRDSGEYENKGFWLSKEYEWSIVKDSKDLLVLVPKNKI